MNVYLVMSIVLALVFVLEAGVFENEEKDERKDEGTERS